MCPVLYFFRMLPLADDSIDVLDGAMITTAILTLNIAHPGYLLKRHDATLKLSSSKEGSETPV